MVLPEGTQGAKIKTKSERHENGKFTLYTCGYPGYCLGGWVCRLRSRTFNSHSSCRCSYCNAVECV